MNIPYWGFYVQDDWRITPRLTLNLGLRYELFMQPQINLGSGLQNAKSNFFENLNETEPTIDVVFDQWLLPQSSSDCACRVDKNDWAPRIGLAYRITDNTVSQGFQLYDIDLKAPLDEYSSVVVGGEGGANVPFFKKTINVYQWFFDVQHQLPWDILMTIGYNGTTAHNLPWWQRNFAVAAGPGIGNPGSPSRWRLKGPAETNTLYQLRNFVVTGDNMLNSNYNAFTFKTEKRFSEGLSFTSSFTWSKGLDYSVSSLNERTEGIVGGAGPLSPYTKDLFRNRGPGGLSRDFAYNLSVIYELPAGPGRGRFESGPASWILGGWQVGGILSLQSGPWGTHIWNPNLQNAGGADRGDLVGYPNLPESQRDSMVWWDHSAIAAGTPGQWHNAGRGLVELPGWKNMDLLLSKYFQMPWEGHRLQFRFEAFNLTNTPHLGGPGNNNPVRNINANSSAAARIFLADQPRIIQFALKYTF